MTGEPIILFDQVFLPCYNGYILSKGGIVISIMIISMTQECVVLSADSLMTGAKVSERFPKIFEYSDNLAMFTVGIAGLSAGFFSVLRTGREKISSTLSYSEAVSITHEWRDAVDHDASIPEGAWCAAGICGIINGAPEITIVKVDKGASHPDEVLVPKPGTITFRILPPSDISEEECNSLFRSNCSCISRLPTVTSLLSLAKITIGQLSPHSLVINDKVQYWAYDVHTRRSQSRLYDCSTWPF